MYGCQGCKVNSVSKCKISFKKSNLQIKNHNKEIVFCRMYFCTDFVFSKIQITFT